MLEVYGPRSTRERLSLRYVGSPRSCRAPELTILLSQNDFAALVDEEVLPPPSDDPSGLYKVETARGKCYVICFSPRHDLTVAEMNDAEIAGVVRTW